MEQSNADSLVVSAIDLAPVVGVRLLPAFERRLNVNVRETPMLARTPWIHTLGKLSFDVNTYGWRFPSPEHPLPEVFRRLDPPKAKLAEPRPKTRVRPPSDMVIFKDRLLYLLQPPLENLFANKQIELPFPPYPYQIKGIAFLMPRHAALLADEMGLGKTAQVIIALRLLFQSGLIRRALIVCPKPLVVNWTRELKLWAADLPYEVIGGDAATRKAQWFASRCPVKLVNYELLTRDEDWLVGPTFLSAVDAEDAIGRQECLPHQPNPAPHFDIVVLDEAQRIKNRDAKTARVVRSISRDRSWAMTGTPIENRIDDLINIFAFVDPERVPPDTPAKLLPELTGDAILRRVKEDVMTDMPAKVIQDVYLDLSPAQRASYDLAEKEGIIHLNELGDTISVQHVFELVLRLKQICNFDPRTGESAKLEQLSADLDEVADNGRKAIIFSQWVEPLETMAKALSEFGPLQYHGKIPQRERQPILDLFKTDKSKHVLLMSYGTGSVGLNLQFTNYVFLFDRWWNPAIEDQAINRAHRIGQKETVFVKRFISVNTIEGRIAEVLEKKRQLFEELIAQNGPPPALGLNEEEIFGLFNVKPRPKKAGSGQQTADSRP
jgi:SNF2 family DNA or RNA helicase